MCSSFNPPPTNVIALHRLLTRNGHDWSDRYPWIVESAQKNRQKHFVIDGEAVVLGVDGVPDFNALHSRKHDEEVQLYAFDVLALDGEDLRNLPLTMRNRVGSNSTVRLHPWDGSLPLDSFRAVRMPATEAVGHIRTQASQQRNR